MCLNCNNLKIESVSLETINDEIITLSSDEFDIGFYMRKFKIRNDDLPNWTLKYEIVFTGKFDRDKVNTYDFGSKEMIEELNNQKNTEIFKNSYRELESIFWVKINGHNIPNLKDENSISIKLIGRNNPIKIDSIINYDNKDEIPTIEFDRNENDPIK
jgi:hypothetical protein